MSWFGNWFGRWFGGWFGQQRRLTPAASAKHVRAQVREAFALQVTGLATTGANVFQSRMRALQTSELPGLRIYTEMEDILDDDVLDVPYMQQRTITVRCEALARATAGLDDLLDGICKEIEAAIDAEPTLGGLSPVHVSYRHFDELLQGDSDQPAGMATLDFDFVVLTMSNTPNIAL